MEAISYKKKQSGLVWVCVAQENHPRHFLILWLAMRGRLNTKDKLVRCGIIFNWTYNLCNTCDETIEHLSSNVTLVLLSWETWLALTMWGIALKIGEAIWGSLLENGKEMILAMWLMKCSWEPVCMLFGEKEMKEASQETWIRKKKLCKL